MQNKEYSEKFGISQSAIKDFRHKSPKKWKELWIDKQIDYSKYDETFTLGSFLDTLLFTPEELEKRFYVGEEANLPSDAIVWIIKDYYNKINTFNENQRILDNELPLGAQIIHLTLEHEKLLLESADNYVSKDKDGKEKIGWNTKWSSEARLKNIKEQGSEYFESLKKAAGKKIISQKMNFDAIALRDILYSEPSIRDYFVPNEDNLLINQLEIFTTHTLQSGKEIPIKGALDIVRFNHKDKTVQIIDFKSSYSAFDFLQSIKKYGYCDQLSFYTYLLDRWLVDYCNGKYCEYTPIVPINIVIDVSDQIPYVYEYSWEDLENSRKGIETEFKTKVGWESILEEIGWHYTYEQWNIPKEMYVTGRIKVKL